MVAAMTRVARTMVASVRYQGRLDLVSWRRARVVVRPMTINKKKRP